MVQRQLEHGVRGDRHHRADQQQRGAARRAHLGVEEAEEATDGVGSQAVPPRMSNSAARAAKARSAA